MFIFRKENQPLTLTNKAEVNDLVPTYLMGGVIVLLILASFLPEPTNASLVTLYNLRNGIICITFLIVGLVLNICKNKNTKMAKEYEEEQFHLLTQEEYVEIVCEQLTYLPKEIVLERLTGDGIASDLITPLWTIKKVCVLNEIDKYMAKNNLYQGMNT